jgi:hypothetical protein
MMIAALEAENAATLAINQSIIQKEKINNEGQDKHQGWFQPAARTASIPVINKQWPEK